MYTTANSSAVFACMVQQSETQPMAFFLQLALQKNKLQVTGGLLCGGPFWSKMLKLFNLPHHFYWCNILYIIFFYITCIIL